MYLFIELILAEDDTIMLFELLLKLRKVKTNELMGLLVTLLRR